MRRKILYMKRGLILCRFTWNKPPNSRKYHWNYDDLRNNASKNISFLKYFSSRRCFQVKKSSKTRETDILVTKYQSFHVKQILKWNLIIHFLERTNQKSAIKKFCKHVRIDTTGNHPNTQKFLAMFHVKQISHQNQRILWTSRYYRTRWAICCNIWRHISSYGTAMKNSSVISKQNRNPKGSELCAYMTTIRCLTWNKLRKFWNDLKTDHKLEHN